MADMSKQPIEFLRDYIHRCNVLKLTDGKNYVAAVAELERRNSDSKTEG
jgi:hypothetical protein